MNLADTYAFTGTVTGAGGVNDSSICSSNKYRKYTNITDDTYTKMTFSNRNFDTDNTADGFVQITDLLQQLLENI